MNISTKEALATGTVLAAIGLIAVAIAWTYTQVEDANRQRQQAGEIARGLSELRLVTFEYRENRLERARAVARHLRTTRSAAGEQQVLGTGAK